MSAYVNYGIVEPSTAMIHFVDAPRVKDVFWIE